MGGWVWGWIGVLVIASIACTKWGGAGGRESCVVWCGCGLDGAGIVMFCWKYTTIWLYLSSHVYIYTYI